MTNPIGTPVCACEAIKVSYRQTSKGIFITFSVHPDDMIDELSRMPLGEVVKLYVTTRDIGV